jgi:phage shock protein E
MSIFDKFLGRQKDTQSDKSIPPNAVWVDCRQLDEYQCGHLEEAIHIPHSEIANRHEELEVDKNRPLYLYCAGGKRAEMAKQCLEAEGYTHVVNAGGLKDALKKAKEAG